MSAANDFISAQTGFVFEHHGFDEPVGFKWANGQALGREAYPRLFAQLTRQVSGVTTNASPNVTGVSADLTAIVSIGMPISGPNIQAGTVVAGITSNTITLSLNATASATSTLTIAPHGVGDGSTTFNVPDKRGRVAVGRDNMGGSAASRVTNSGTGNPGINGVLLGAAGGADRHALTVGQMPAHTHNVGRSTSAAQQGPNEPIVNNSPATSPVTTSSAGSGEAHPIMPPTYVCNYVIKT